MHKADLLYHPDEPAETIVRADTGEVSFTAEECVQLNAAVDSLFAWHGDLVYTVGLHFVRKAGGIKPEINETTSFAG